MPALGLPKSIHRDQSTSSVSSSVFQDAEEESDTPSMQGSPPPQIPMAAKRASPVRHRARFAETHTILTPLSQKHKPAQQYDLSQTSRPSQVIPVEQHQSPVAHLETPSSASPLDARTRKSGNNSLRRQVSAMSSNPTKLNKSNLADTQDFLNTNAHTQKPAAFSPQPRLKVNAADPLKESFYGQMHTPKTSMKQTTPQLHRFWSNFVMCVFVFAMIILAYTKRLICLPGHLCRKFILWLEHEVADAMAAMPRTNPAALFGFHSDTAATKTANDTPTENPTTAEAAFTSPVHAHLQHVCVNNSTVPTTPPLRQERRTSRVSFSSIVSVKELGGYTGHDAGTTTSPAPRTVQPVSVPSKEASPSSTLSTAPSSAMNLPPALANATAPSTKPEFTKTDAPFGKTGSKHDYIGHVIYSSDKDKDLIMSPLSLETPTRETSDLGSMNDAHSDSETSLSGLERENSLCLRPQRSRSTSTVSGNVAQRSVMILRKKMSRTGSGLSEVARKVTLSRAIKRNKTDSETRFLSDRSARATFNFFADVLMKEQDYTVALRRNGALKFRCSKRLSYDNHVDAKVAFLPRGSNSCVVVVYPGHEDNDDTPLSPDYISFVSELQRCFVSAVLESKN